MQEQYFHFHPTLLQKHLETVGQMSFGGHTEHTYLFKVKPNEYDQDRRLQSTFHALFTLQLSIILSPNYSFYSDYLMALLTKMPES